MASTLLRVGSGSYQQVLTPTLDPSSINANSISVETFTVTGVNVDTQYRVDAPNLEAGLFIIGSTCATANVLTLSIWNSTNGAVNPASQVFRVIGL